MTHVTVIAMALFLLISGCAAPLYTQNTMEQVIQDREAALCKEYMEKLSQISGRLDGMNKTIVKGLVETLDTARTSREIAEEALAVARGNNTGKKGAGGEKEAENNDEDGFQFTPMDE